MFEKQNFIIGDHNENKRSADYAQRWREKLDNKNKSYQYQDETNTVYHVAIANIFCTLSLNICGSAVWYLLQVTFLAPRILRYFLDFEKKFCNSDQNTFEDLVVFFRFTTQQLDVAADQWEGKRTCVKKCYHQLKLIRININHNKNSLICNS
jgi:hypothetical protein